MSTHSLNGREWARLSQLKVGDRITPDGGFTCLREGVPVKVCEIDGKLYVRCIHHWHALEAQLFGEDEDHLVGLWADKPRALAAHIACGTALLAVALAFLLLLHTHGHRVFRDLSAAEYSAPVPLERPAREGLLQDGQKGAVQ